MGAAPREAGLLAAKQCSHGLWLPWAGIEVKQSAQAVGCPALEGDTELMCEEGASCAPWGQELCLVLYCVRY